MNGMKHPPLNVGHDTAAVLLVPAPVETLGHGAELDDEVSGKIFRFDLSALLPPKLEQGSLVAAHNDPGV